MDAPLAMLRRMSPSTDWKEQVPPGEAAKFEGHAARLRELQKRAAEGGKANRALHARGRGGLKAEFTVLSDLPEEARQGLFAQPGTYQAYVRFSNGAGKRQPDRTPDVRGAAIKVLGVAGKKLIPGLEDAPTQDFLLIRAPSTPFATADDFLKLVFAVENKLLALPRLIGAFGFGIFKKLGPLSKGLGAPIGSVATSTYYSALPIQYGPYAVKVSLRPHLPAPAGEATPEDLHAELSARLKLNPISYDVRVQFFVSEEKTPIEDASVEWLEADAPWVTVGRLTLPAQDVDSIEGQKRATYVESLSFDPWHALVAHKPLGNMMRARSPAYRVSTQERGVAKEPDGTESFE
jgi:hypothetical protein